MRFSFFILTFAVLFSGPVFAQFETPAQVDFDHSVPVVEDSFGNEMPLTPVVPEQPDEIQPLQYEQQAYALLQTLDKVTARTTTVLLPVNKPSAVGPLVIDVKTCQKTPPSEQPEAAAFLQVWEAKQKSHDKQQPKSSTDEDESQWVFSGWMFASSPALSAMDNAVYDVWLKDCTNEAAVSDEK